MNSIGETFRRERLQRELDLDQIARELKIAARMLDAIECEQFEKLPGGVFTKSFVRQYARYLGLDEDEMVGEVQRRLEPPAPTFETAAGRGKPSPDVSLPKVEDWQEVGDRGFRWSGSLKAGAGVVAVMLVCSGVYTWWQSRPAPVENAPAAHAPTPPVAAPEPTPTGPTGAPIAASGPEASAPSPGVAATTPAPATTDAAPPAAAPPATAPPAEPRGVGRQTQPNPDATVHVQLTASEATWVLVRVDGKYAFSGTLGANETRSVDGTGAVLVRLGNAGGVSLTHNGKELGNVGPKGQVRTVQFTSGGFQIVPPAAASKPPAPAAAPEAR
jgi:cytoskeleton protein RodZ